MLEKNWKAWLSENEKVRRFPYPPYISSSSVKMAEDDIPMKQRIEEVLTDIGLSETRAAKMDIDDILRMLSAFHDQGIHFA